MNPPPFQPLQRRGLLTLMASAPVGQWLRRPGRWPRCGSITSNPGVAPATWAWSSSVPGRHHGGQHQRPFAAGRNHRAGDLSHASVVFSRDGRYAYVFGRDGGLTQVDLLRERIVHRVMQAGNSIGGAVSADGTLVAAQNYVPGGVKVFDAKTLELLADLPATYGNGQRSRVVGLVDLPPAPLSTACSMPMRSASPIALTPPPRVHTLEGIGRQPYDALVTPDGATTSPACSVKTAWPWWTCGNPSPRCGAFWPVTAGASSRCRCTRCRTCAAGPWRAPRLPARHWPPRGAGGGHHHLARGGAYPRSGPARVRDGPARWPPGVGELCRADYDRVQVIDTPASAWWRPCARQGRAAHGIHAARGDAVWISCRDDHLVRVIDTATRQTLATLAVDAPAASFHGARPAHGF